MLQMIPDPSKPLSIEQILERQLAGWRTWLGDQVEALGHNPDLAAKLFGALSATAEIAAGVAAGAAATEASEPVLATAAVAFGAVATAATIYSVGTDWRQFISHPSESTLGASLWDTFIGALEIRIGHVAEKYSDEDASRLVKGLFNGLSQIVEDLFGSYPSDTEQPRNLAFPRFPPVIRVPERVQEKGLLAIWLWENAYL